MNPEEIVIRAVARAYHERQQGKRYQTGLAKRLREYLQKLGPRKRFNPAKIARELGEPGSIRVQDALRDFERRGEVVKLRPGEYLYEGSDMLHIRPANIKPRVMRAIYASGAFTGREIGILSDARKQWVKKLLAKLVDRGDLVVIGRRNIPRKGGVERVFRVKNREDFLLKYIKGPERAGRAHGRATIEEKEARRADE